VWLVGLVCGNLLRRRRGLRARSRRCRSCRRRGLREVLAEVGYDLIELVLVQRHPVGDHAIDGRFPFCGSLALCRDEIEVMTSGAVLRHDVFAGSVRQRRRLRAHGQREEKARAENRGGKPVSVALRLAEH